MRPVVLAFAIPLLTLALLPLAALTSPTARAEGADAPVGTPALALQFTQVVQWHPAFPARYSGGNSLRADADSNQTTDLTAFLAVPLGTRLAFYADSEVDQGFGLSDTLGVAGFPSAEAFKVGNHAPRLRLPRLFVHLDVDLAGRPEAQLAGVHQVAQERAPERLGLTVGKFAVTDLFDTNRYAHDARADFLNWSVVDAGAFDYAADAFGFTYGAAAEWVHPDWVLRAGGFALSSVPNGTTVDGSGRQYQLVAEFEQALSWQGRAGALRLLAFSNRGRMARYQDAVRAADPGQLPDLAAVRTTARRAGIVVNLEQALTERAGLFARFSRNQGDYEAFDFTEINQSLAAGWVLQGDGWGRAADRVGAAWVRNQLSAPAQQYFAAGGLGLLIGDGALRYGAESVLEGYYRVACSAALSVTFDLQHIRNPAYNRDRGPVSVVGLRVHADY